MHFLMFFVFWVFFWEEFGILGGGGKSPQEIAGNNTVFQRLTTITTINVACIVDILSED